MLAVLTAGAGVYILTSEDPNYLLRETIFAWRYQKIRRSYSTGLRALRGGARTHQGRYLARKPVPAPKGWTQGERGLMQITEKPPRIGRVPKNSNLCLYRSFRSQGEHRSGHMVSESSADIIGRRRITLCRSLWRNTMPAAHAFGAGCKIPAWERPPAQEIFRQRWISR